MRYFLVVGLWIAVSAAGPVAVSAQEGSPPPQQPESERVNRARQLFQEALAAYDEGNFPQAAEKMQEAYRLAQSPDLAFNLGRVYERMSEYDQAIRYFRIYLRSRRGSEAEQAEVQARVAALREAKRRSRDQVFTAPPSTDELTQEARAFFLRGVAMYQRRQYEAAMQAFAAALRFRELPEIYYNMAVTAQRLGQNRDAIDWYDEYLDLAPRAPDRGHVEREIARLRAR